MNWYLRITHTPTGVSVETNSKFFRSMHTGRDMLIKLLKARIWQREHMQGNMDNVVAEYNFPDGEPYPNDISIYRAPKQP